MTFQYLYIFYLYNHNLVSTVCILYDQSNRQNNIIQVGSSIWKNSGELNKEISLQIFQIQMSNIEYSEQVMQVVQQIIPELTRQIENEERERMHLIVDKFLDQKREQVRDAYTHRLEQQSKQLHNDSLNKISSIKQKIFDKRREIEQLKNKKYTPISMQMTETEKRNFVEDTVKEIANSGMIHEIRQNISKKVNRQLQLEYDQKLKEHINQIKKQLQESNNETKKQRKEHLTQMLQKEIGERLKAIQNQKENIDMQKENLRYKLQLSKSERDRMKSQYQQMCQSYSNQIGRLKKQIKELRESI